MRVDCECPFSSDAHAKGQCDTPAHYAVLRIDHIVFVCPECKMPEDTCVREIKESHEDKVST